MAFYKIRDVEVLTGIKAHTLRIWEQRYGVLVPERTETKIRTYTDEELVYLLNIRILIDHGMKISRLSEFSPTEIRAKVAEIKLKTPAGSAQEKLIVSLVEMDEALFHSTLNELIHATPNMSFASSETTSVHQALQTWCPTQPPMFTIVDIVEQGRVPILFSLQQMQNLSIILDMRPDKVLIPCEALGLHRVQATQA